MSFPPDRGPGGLATQACPVQAGPPSMANPCRRSGSGTPASWPHPGTQSGFQEAMHNCVHLHRGLPLLCSTSAMGRHLQLGLHPQAVRCQGASCGCEVWFGTCCTDFTKGQRAEAAEQVHRDFLHGILGVSQYAHTAAVLAELGTDTLAVPRARVASLGGQTGSVFLSVQTLSSLQLSLRRGEHACSLFTTEEAPHMQIST